MNEKGLTTEVAVLQPLSAQQLQQQVNEIQRAMKAVMKDGTHYGVVPGCGDKPALLKAGAEKLCMMFRMIPHLDEQIKDLAGGHREYLIRCTLKTLDGLTMGQGVGSCSTMETKYRYISAARKCPQCGAEAIIVGKKEYGGGFLCYGKKGGCGAKFKDGDPEILDQQTGKIERPDPADTYNTVLKMAKKRALVDAAITATAASDIFTQDIDENADIEARPEPQKPKTADEAASAPAQSVYYNIDGDLSSDQSRYLEKRGVEWSDEYGCWVAPKDLGPKFAKYKVSKPRSLIGEAERDDLPESFDTPLGEQIDGGAEVEGSY